MWSLCEKDRERRSQGEKDSHKGHPLPSKCFEAHGGRLHYIAGPSWRKSLKGEQRKPIAGLSANHREQGQPTNAFSKRSWKTEVIALCGSTYTHSDGRPRVNTLSIPISPRALLAQSLGTREHFENTVTYTVRIMHRRKVAIGESRQRYFLTFLTNTRTIKVTYDQAQGTI